MRTLSTSGAAIIAGPVVPLTLLIEMYLTSTLYLNLGPIDLIYGGQTYLGTAGIGKVDAVQETPAEIPQLRFEISGVPQEEIALALTEQVQGKRAVIYFAIFDPVTYQIVDVHQRWDGQLDVMTIVDGLGTATIRVTAETAGIDLSRPGDSPYTDYEQQRLNPGDLSLQYLNDQVDQKIIWPAASFFQQ
jgi:hypothetical protein